jgi:predicted nuclease of predicted toxin-antitoxin system
VTETPLLSLLIDECVDVLAFPWEMIVSRQCFHVRSIAPAADDVDILALARKRGLILVTEDRDYGELIYRHRAPSPPGIIYIALAGLRLSARPQRLRTVLGDVLDHADGKFIVIGPSNVRTRQLP